MIWDDMSGYFAFDHLIVLEALFLPEEAADQSSEGAFMHILVTGMQIQADFDMRCFTCSGLLCKVPITETGNPDKNARSDLIDLQLQVQRYVDYEFPPSAVSLLGEPPALKPRRSARRVGSRLCITRKGRFA